MDKVTEAYGMTKNVFGRYECTTAVQPSSLVLLRLVLFIRIPNINVYHFSPVAVFPQYNKNGLAHIKLMEVFQANFLGAIETGVILREGRRKGESGYDLERDAPMGCVCEEGVLKEQYY